jgi:hypothetical protein
MRVRWQHVFGYTCSPGTRPASHRHSKLPQVTRSHTHTQNLGGGEEGLKVCDFLLFERENVSADPQDGMQKKDARGLRREVNC